MYSEAQNVQEKMCLNSLEEKFPPPCPLCM